MVLLFAGCTDQRDIYTTAHPALYIEGDWEPSLHTTNMSMNATAIMYNGDGSQAVLKKYFVAPNSVVAPLTKGMYNILLFNGLMYSETDTHLDGVYFRATDRLNSFEAVVKEGEANRRLVRAPSEYIASNDMEILTSGCGEQEMNDEVGYHIKYKNGKNGYPTPGDYIERSLYMTPFAVSYECRVVIDLVNPSSAYAANGALRGFVGSVLMASRTPSHMDVTHQFRLNDKIITGSNPETGTIQSPVFVTFGPPLDLPDRRYTLEVSIVLVDGTEYNQTFDITDQINTVITKIRDNIGASEPIEVDITIPLEIEIELPEVEPIEGQIGVGDWEDDEIITVPITKP